MKLPEIMERCDEWEDKHKGTSPLVYNSMVSLERMVDQGKVIKELVAVYDNGIHLYSYSDLQGRLVASSSPQARDERKCVINEILERKEEL